MNAIPAFAPGCFGSALAYQAEHSVCKGCKFAAQCAPLHEQNYAALRERFHIKEKRARFEMGEASEVNPDPGAKVLPKKTLELIEKLDRMDIDVTGKLKRGENPFSGERMPWLAVVCHLLLKLQRPLRHNELVPVFCKRFPWTQGTADSQARQALQALQHIGAVDEIDGGYSLRRH